LRTAIRPTSPVPRIAGCQDPALQDAPTKQHRAKPAAATQNNSRTCIKSPTAVYEPGNRRTGGPSPGAHHFRAAHGRTRRPPNAWHSARPHTVLPATVKPDYRGCEQLPRRMRSSIVITPAFHSAGMHGVDRVTVTSRPHRVVVSAGQPIRCQSCFCSRISPQRRSAQDTVLFHAIALSFLMARS
jgi:hypothetical protein